MYWVILISAADVIDGIMMIGQPNVIPATASWKHVSFPTFLVQLFCYVPQKDKISIYFIALQNTYMIVLNQTPYPHTSQVFCTDVSGWNTMQISWYGYRKSKYAILQMLTASFIDI